jgi:putative transposase
MTAHRALHNGDAAPPALELFSPVTPGFCPGLSYFGPPGLGFCGRERSIVCWIRLQVPMLRAPEARPMKALGVSPGWAVTIQSESRRDGIWGIPTTICWCISCSERKADGRLFLCAKWMNLWRYFGGIAKRNGISLLCAGGMQDHVHLLIILPTTMTMANAIRIFKANSSRWLSPTFEWQQGYGVFAVSASNRDKVRSYIANQEKHHRRRTFEEEFLILLKSAGVDYDPKYVFG